MIRTWSTGISVLLGICIGCSPAERSVTESANTLRLYYQGNETVFSPADWVPFRQLIFATFLRRGADGVEGWLVDEWSSSGDGRTWTYHIRDNATWHDGVPVTTADIAYSLDLLNNPPVRQPTEPHFELDVLSDKTFRITYDDQVTKDNLEWDVVCFPKHQLEVLDRDGFWFWDFWKEPVGNGPFRYVRHDPEIMTALAANRDYFLPGPTVDSLVIRYGGDAVTELLAGNVDVHVWAAAEDIPKLRHNEALDHTIYGGSVSILYWNHARPFFREPEARRALTMAIDRRSMLASRGLDRDLPIVDAPVEFIRRPLPSEPLAHDPAAAARSLGALGWNDDDGDGVLERDGIEFRFELLVHTQIQAGEAIIVQENLGRIGIDVEITTRERLTVKSLVSNGDFDAAISFGRYWPAFLLGIDVRGEPLVEPLSPVGYDLGDLYAAFESYRQDFVDDVGARFDQRLWEIFQRDVPATVLEPSATVVAFNTRVRGLKPFLGFAFMDQISIE